MRILFFLLLTLTSLLAYDYTIPKSELQTRLTKAFPIVKKTMFLTLKVSDPKLSLDGKKQRFNLKAKLTIPNIKDDKGRSAQAIITLSSRIAYSKGGNLYLRKIKVVDIKSSMINQDMKNMLFGTLEEIAQEYFKSRPIYSLKDEEGMVGMAVKAIENVKIVHKGIKIIFVI